MTSGSAAGLLAGLRPGFAADAQVEVSVQDPGPQISPHIYGHFIEHLGAVIYDGIWVGRNSRILNINGIRRRFVEDMKRIGAPNLRWPGGCFADGYHWRDGIGPVAKRPRTYNFWQPRMPAGVDHTENNHFGLHEFMELCRLVGAEPYLAANVGSGSPQEMQDWVLYCNAPAGTVSLAAERAANGSTEPFKVRWWGIGNESWGCGGDMKPQEYATLYRRFVTQFPGYPPKPYLVAVGPRGHSRDLDVGWTTGFFEGMQGGHRSPVDGLSLHFYTDFRNTKEKVASFEPQGWFDVLSEAHRTEDVILKHWDAMGKYDPKHRTKLIVDEWGVWYPPGEETAPSHLLSQPVTLRDALHTAITFDVFNRHADKIAMANVAQTVNCLHSLFLTDEDRYTRTPPFYVFEMYRRHFDGRSVPLQIRADGASVPSRPGSGKIPSLSGSASLKANTLAVTLTNPSLDSAMNVQVRLKSGTLKEGRAAVLTHPQMTARNTFERPNEVGIEKLSVQIRGSVATVAIPKQAVVAIDLGISSS